MAQLLLTAGGAAAKGGIATLTLVQAAEHGRHDGGVLCGWLCGPPHFRAAQAQGRRPAP